MSFDRFVYDSSHFSTFLGSSDQAEYIIRYLRDLGAVTCVRETEYIDRGYMIDFQKFYSRSFEKHPKVTERIHFFSLDFNNEKFLESINNNNNLFFKKLNNKYLGFVVVKPIKDALDNFVIGRTLLKSYPPEIDSRKRFYIKINNEISLFGIKLNIESIPFQAQDQGVSACATIALWTAFQSIRRLFNIPSLSPSEITEASIQFPSTGRMFPQTGLNWGQMVYCIRANGLDAEIIKTDNLENDHMITTSIKAYLNMDVPLISLLELEKEGKYYYHASVITGYQYDEDNNITELYVHDDQIGPYCKVLPVGDFRIWSNEWSTEWGYVVKPYILLIPVYPKIRQTFIRMYELFKRTIHEIHRDYPDLANDIDVRMVLSTIQQYKLYLLSKDIDRKIELLTKSFSRFLLVLNFLLEKEPWFDIIYDGTAVYPTELGRVDF